MLSLLVAAAISSSLSAALPGVEALDAPIRIRPEQVRVASPSFLDVGQAIDGQPSPVSRLVVEGLGAFAGEALLGGVGALVGCTAYNLRNGGGGQADYDFGCLGGAIFGVLLGVPVGALLGTYLAGGWMGGTGGFFGTLLGTAVGTGLGLIVIALNPGSATALIVAAASTGVGAVVGYELSASPARRPDALEARGPALTFRF